MICMVISYVLWAAVAALVSTIPIVGGLGVLYGCSGSSDWDPACVWDGCDVLRLDPYMPSADVALGLQGMLPMYLAWPNALQTSPGCA